MPSATRHRNQTTTRRHRGPTHPTSFTNRLLGALGLWSHRDAMDDLSHAIVSGAIKSTAIMLLQQVVDTNDVEQIRLWTSSSRRLSLYGYFLQTHDGAEPRLSSASRQCVAEAARENA